MIKKNYSNITVNEAQRGKSGQSDESWIYSKRYAWHPAKHDLLHAWQELTWSCARSAINQRYGRHNNKGDDVTGMSWWSSTFCPRSAQCWQLIDNLGDYIRLLAPLSSRLMAGDCHEIGTTSRGPTPAQPKFCVGSRLLPHCSSDFRGRGTTHYRPDIASPYVGIYRGPCTP